MACGEEALSEAELKQMSEGALNLSFLKKIAPGLAIVILALFLDLLYVSRPAWVWDETYYYPFATGIRRWVADPSLDEAVINAVFREGNAHPPLPLYAMAITGKLMQADVSDFLLAVRLAGCLQFAGLALLVYLGWLFVEFLRDGFV